MTASPHPLSGSTNCRNANACPREIVATHRYELWVMADEAITAAYEEWFGDSPDGEWQELAFDAGDELGDWLEASFLAEFAVGKGHWEELGC